MEVNAVPIYDMSDSPTGCCPRFDPTGWDGQELHFKDKRFVKAKTRSIMHFPLNMGPVFARTMKAIEDVDGFVEDGSIVLSRDPSAWIGEHYFAVKKDVPGQEMTSMSGDFVTKVFEGPYKDVPKWAVEAEKYAKGQGKAVDRIFFFFTTCPKCAKSYGKNYVIAVAQVH
ncbi:MAG: hypothetical protein HKM95_04885 [Inquilinus sp.]|nr:hypothetical protein [Inquilinus sp.]